MGELTLRTPVRHPWKHPHTACMQKAQLSSLHKSYETQAVRTTWPGSSLGWWTRLSLWSFRTAQHVVQ